MTTSRYEGREEKRGLEVVRLSLEPLGIFEGLGVTSLRPHSFERYLPEASAPPTLYTANTSEALRNELVLIWYLQMPLK